MNNIKQNCPMCFGKGYTERYETVPDTTMGIALGTALGIGYFPSTKQELHRYPCYRCNGSGKL